MLQYQGDRRVKLGLVTPEHLKFIKELQTNSKLMSTKSEKRDGISIINELDYIEKVNEYNSTSTKTPNKNNRKTQSEKTNFIEITSPKSEWNDWPLNFWADRTSLCNNSLKVRPTD